MLVGVLCAPLIMPAAVSAVTTLVGSEFTGGLIRPATIRWSTDGDFVSTGLRWRGWGNGTTTATGRFRFRITPRTYVTRSGSVTLGDRQSVCGGATGGNAYYYAKAFFHVAHSPWGRLPPEELLPPTSGFTCPYEPPGQ